MKVINLSAKKFLILICASLLTLYMACTGNSIKIKTTLTSDSTPVVKAIQKPPCSSSDTLIIKSSSAVFFKPDSIQVEKYKAIASNLVFESMKHDCYFQQRNSRIVLKKDWPEIHIIDAFTVRYLLFIKSDQSKIMIDLDKKGDLCGIFLFNKIKDPELIDMMNVETALEYYFKH